MKLPVEEQAEYKSFMANMRNEASRAFTLKIDMDDAVLNAVSNTLKNTHEKYIIKLWNKGMPIEDIADLAEMSIEDVTQFIENYKNGN